MVGSVKGSARARKGGQRWCGAEGKYGMGNDREDPGETEIEVGQCWRGRGQGKLKA